MTKTIDGIPHLSAESAAAALGTTKLKILILLKGGTLKGACLDGGWYVTEGSVAQYRAEEPSPAKTGCLTGCSSCSCH